MNYIFGLANADEYKNPALPDMCMSPAALQHDELMDFNPTQEP